MMNNKSTAKLAFIFELVIILALSTSCKISSEYTSRHQLNEETVEDPVMDMESSIQTDVTRDIFLYESLRISELMSSNHTSIVSKDGNKDDWIEIINIGDTSIQIDGCWLSNDIDNPMKWRIPSYELNSNEKLVIFCSDNENNTELFHANFPLEKNGGDVILSSPSGNVIDHVSYDKMNKDSSAVYYINGEKLSSPVITFLSTPGFDNSNEGYEEYLKTIEKTKKLVINEVVTHNNSYSKQHGKYYDWIELKNISQEPIKLSNYYLSDDYDNLQKSHLPNKELKPGELIVIFCSGDSELSNSNYYHVDFSISENEQIFLTESDYTISDEIFLHDIPLNGSVGRTENEAGFWYFEKSTPGINNSNGYREISQSPTASIDEGVFLPQESFIVELMGKGDIYYTLDGSIPNQDAMLYVSPIEITDTTIIRAVIIEDGKMISHASTFSYIFNENNYLPVTSLVCDPNEMFGRNGVYYAPRANDVKCDANVSFFDLDNEGFSSECAVELHGARSRTAYEKKSFELKFSNRYGGELEYDLFKDGNITHFHSLLLRGGSSVKLDIIRDSFASKVVYEVCPELYPQDVRYTAVYINGQYYGIYSWRESYSEEYFESHADVDKNDVQIVRAPLNDTSELWRIMNCLGITKNKSKFEYLSDNIDMSSVARWFAMQAYFNNYDINGNIRYVKLGQEAKWQIILYDLDFSLLDSHPSWDTALCSYQMGDTLCRYLISTQEFREILLEECAQLYRNGFTTENIIKIYDNLLLDLDDVSVKKDCARWNSNFTKWEKNIKTTRNNLNDSRMIEWLNGLKRLTNATNNQMHDRFPEYF